MMKNNLKKRQCKNGFNCPNKNSICVFGHPDEYSHIATVFPDKEEKETSGTNFWSMFKG